MTNEEIKKAWNTFKRQAKAECGLDGYTFVMNAKQIEKRTATICLAFGFGDYDDEIEYWEKYLEKNTNSLYGQDMLAKNIERKEKYGSRITKVNSEVKAIEESIAFAKFNDSVGGTAKVYLEVKNESGGNSYYARFTY